MTTIHAQLVGDKALLSRSELEKLVRIARLSEEIALQCHDDDLPTIGMTRLAEQGGSFDYWNEPGESIYTLQDGKLVS